MAIPPGHDLYASGSDRDLYDHYRDLGLSPEVAKQHVELRRAQRKMPGESAAPEAPGVPESAALGFGEGASSGLASRAGDLLPGPSNSARLSQARSAHPFVTEGADLAGAVAQGLLASRLPGIRAMSPTAQGFTVGGGTGATRGYVEGGPLGALLGGGVGALSGWTAGKVLEKVLPAGRVAGEDIRAFFTKAPKVPAAAPDPDAALRASLSKIPGLRPEDLERAVASAKKAALPRATPRATIDPLEVATAIRRGIIEPSTAGTRGYRPAGPKTSKPGKPIWYGSGSPTKSAAVRGGERLLPDPRPGALLRQTPFQTLQATLREPTTPQMVKDAILQEIQRRGIVGEGLLPPLLR